MSAIVKIYGNHVVAGKRLFEDVPPAIQEAVKAYVISLDSEFFGTDTPTDNTSDDNVQGPGVSDIMSASSESGSGGIEQDGTEESTDSNISENASEAVDAASSDSSSETVVNTAEDSADMSTAESEAGSDADNK